MSHLQLSRTRIVPEAWQDLPQEENDAKVTAIYAVIGENGGDVKAVGFSPSDTTLTSIIEYPDENSAKRSVAGIIALGTLEFVSIEVLWDVIEWTAMVRAANGLS